MTLVLKAPGESYMNKSHLEMHGLFYMPTYHRTALAAFLCLICLPCCQQNTGCNFFCCLSKQRKGLFPEWDFICDSWFVWGACRNVACITIVILCHPIQAMRKKVKSCQHGGCTYLSMATRDESSSHHHI